MTYKIIADKNQLVRFIDWLPELQENEKYYLSLFARKKYCQSLIKSNDKTQLKRFVSDKDRLFQKITQLELPLGRWLLRDIPAPQESLALYISVNPCCMKKATAMLGKKCWDLMKANNYNIHAEALSCIQKSKSRTCYVDFDIDDKSIHLERDWLNKNIGLNNYKILETRGGYHLLVRPAAATDFRQANFNDKKWHPLIAKKYPIDQVGDQLIPVAGTYQGGFVPRFV